LDLAFGFNFFPVVAYRQRAPSFTWSAAMPYSTNGAGQVNVART
jgi:CRISPR-associated DxTHG motif protein